MLSTGMIKIGIPLIGSIAWHGGITYVESVINSLKTVDLIDRPKVFLLVDNTSENNLKLHINSITLADGLIFIGKDFSLLKTFNEKPIIHLTEFKDILNYVDFIYPVNTNGLPGFVYAGWLPDLQHRYYPQFFSESQLVERENSINFMLQTTNQIVVSSLTAKQDVQEFYPEYEGNIEVIHFYSKFNTELLRLNPKSTLCKYDLPSKYFICCNQFWRHKNHCRIRLYSIHTLPDRVEDRNAILRFHPSFSRRYPPYNKSSIGITLLCMKTTRASSNSLTNELCLLIY